MSRKKEWLSRVIFYSGTLGLLGMLGEMKPTSAEVEAERMREIGASEIVIIFPKS